jgi:ribosomal protein S27E
MPPEVAAELLDEYEDEPIVLYRKAKTWLKKQALALGVVGGCMIIHWYRASDEFKQDTFEQSLKTWEQIRSLGDSWIEMTRFSPHAHIIAYGYLSKPADRYDVYKNKGPLKDRDNVEACAYYALSHCALPIKGQSYFYFGSCSNRQLKCTWSGHTTAPLLCPVCGACLVYPDGRTVHMVEVTMQEFNYVGPPIP